MSYIIYYAFLLREHFYVADFCVFKIEMRCACLCSYVMLFIIVLLNESKWNGNKKEIAKCSWQRKLSKQSKGFQFQRSLMSFVSRNLCHQMQWAAKKSLRFMFSLVYALKYECESNPLRDHKQQLLHREFAQKSIPFQFFHPGERKNYLNELDVLFVCYGLLCVYLFQVFDSWDFKYQNKPSAILSFCVMSEKDLNVSRCQVWSEILNQDDSERSTGPLIKRLWCWQKPFVWSKDLARRKSVLVRKQKIPNAYHISLKRAFYLIFYNMIDILPGR